MISSLLFLLVGVAMVVTYPDEGGVSGLVIGVLCLMVGAWVLVSSVRACLRVTEASLMYRGDLRRRTIPLEEVSGVGVDRAPHPLPWHCVWVELTSGQCLPVRGCQVLALFSSDARVRLSEAAALASERAAAGSRGTHSPIEEG